MLLLQQRLAQNMIHIPLLQRFFKLRLAGGVDAFSNKNGWFMEIYGAPVTRRDGEILLFDGQRRDAAAGFYKRTDVRGRGAAASAQQVRAAVRAPAA